MAEQGTYDLTRFELPDMIRLGTELRELGAGARSMQEVADRTVRFLLERLTDRAGDKALALARFYKTFPCRELDEERRAFATSVLDVGLGDETPCLTLLASAGAEPDWNDIARSRGHRAIPLPSPAIVEQFPMISQLITQFGLSPADVIAPSRELFVEAEQRAYNVFYVADARGSAHVPAQADFVEPYGIASVLGFGGLLPPRDLFAVILFSTVPIPRSVADMFSTVSLNVKLAVLPFARGPVFEPVGVTGPEVTS